MRSEKLEDGIFDRFQDFYRGDGRVGEREGHEARAVWYRNEDRSQVVK